MGIWSSANRSISLPFHVLGSLLLTPYDHCVHIPIITNTYLVIQRSCTCSTLYVACAALPFYPIYSLTALLTTHLPKAVKEVGRTRIDYRPLTEVHTLEEDPWVRFLWFGSSIEFKRARRLSRRPSEETEWAVWTLIDWTGELSISDRAWSFLLWSLNTSLIWVQLEWLLFY